MLKGCRFHHLGIVTDDISATAAAYRAVGYSASEVVTDPLQKTRICFLEQPGFPRLELVSPSEEKSSVTKLLKRGGVSPYHLCYETDDIEAAFEAMTADGYIPLFRPVEAAAMDGRRICYMYRKDVGYVEMLEAFSGAASSSPVTASSSPVMASSFPVTASSSETDKR